MFAPRFPEAVLSDLSPTFEAHVINTAPLQGLPVVVEVAAVVVVVVAVVGMSRSIILAIVLAIVVAVDHP